ncbi:MAG TPA: sigma-70 family RNA polymerase sigma factor [Spirochaetia bacterium]|nr:sigma-70 family RNA polymerase sigma factor [Spirochaetia bacterium]
MVEAIVDLPEAELVRRCQDHDSAATQELYSRYRERVYRTAWKIVLDYDDAMDVTQDVFIRVLRGISKFRHQSALSTWITRITVNTSVDCIRRRKRAAALRRAIEEQEQEPEDSGDDRIDVMDKGERIRAAMGKLNPEQRTCLVLREIDGLSYAEIATMVGISIGTVRSRIHRARSQVRAMVLER